MTTPIKITVLGPNGRLGRAICEAVIDDPRFDLCAAVVRAESALCGQDIGPALGRGDIGCVAEVSIEHAAEGTDVVIDASLPGMTVSAAERLAVMNGPSLVTGVTGFNDDQDARFRATTDQLPVLRAGNFSLGVAIAEALVQQAAALPAREWDIEIHEAHHGQKADAPSGTALLLGRAAARGRDVSLSDEAVYSREGTTGARSTGSIGFSVTRGGGIIGEHAVRFISEMEEVSIAHRAFDRRVFARGALAAANWMHNAAKGRAPGLYSMQDVVRD